MAVSNTIVCDFTETGMAVGSTWRYNYGQRVQLIGDNIDETMTVQWKYNGVTDVDSRAITKEGDNYYSVIPNDALEQADKVLGYIWTFNASVGNTVYMIGINIRDRVSTLEDGSTDDIPVYQQLILDLEELQTELIALQTELYDYTSARYLPNDTDLNTIVPPTYEYGIYVIKSATGTATKHYPVTDGSYDDKTVILELIKNDTLYIQRVCYYSALGIRKFTRIWTGFGFDVWYIQGINGESITGLEINATSGNIELSTGYEIPQSSNVTHTNRTDLDAVSGTNTGDQESSDFDIKDLTDSTDLRTTWSGKQNALGFTAENVANKATVFTTSNDTLYPSVKAVKTELDKKLNLDQTTSQTITGGQPIQNNLTPNELVATDTTKRFINLPVATNPNLDEIKYVKGVTSAIQTQLNNIVSDSNAYQTLQDNIDLGNLSDTIRQTAMVSVTGTGVKNGITLTNPISFKDSGARVEVLGQTLTNLVTNGNFANGDNWVPASATESVSSNVYTLTGNGTSSQPYTRQDVFPAQTAGDKYLVRYKARATNSDCLSIRHRIGDVVVVGILTPMINTWYNISVISTISSTIPFYIYQFYADSATANGKSIEIKEVQAINLTALYGAGNEPTASQMDLIAPTWFDGTVNVVNPRIRTQNSGNTLFNNLEYLGTLRSVFDTATLYRDRLYNSLGKWYVDRYVNPANGLKLPTMATESATVSGIPYVYRNGTTIIETSVIAPVVDYKIPYSDVNNTYVPTLTWTTATPTVTSSSFRYAFKMGRCTLRGQCVMSNGGGATNLTITLPAPVCVGSGQSVVTFHLKINATWSAPIVQIIESTNLITFKAPFSLTNGQAAEFEFFAEYEVA